MAKINVGMSFTVNFTSREIEFAKIHAEITDIDLEQDADLQLGNFDKVSDKAIQMLKMKLKSKLKLAEKM